MTRISHLGSSISVSSIEQKSFVSNPKDLRVSITPDQYVAPSRYSRQPEVRLPRPTICSEFPRDWNVGSVWRDGNSRRYPVYIPSHSFDLMQDLLLSSNCGIQLVQVGTYRNAFPLYMLGSDLRQLRAEGGSRDLRFDFPNGVRVR